MTLQILKLAHMSKEADKIVKGMREWESKTMNNEVITIVIVVIIVITSLIIRWSLKGWTRTQERLEELLQRMR